MESVASQDMNRKPTLRALSKRVRISTIGVGAKLPWDQQDEWQRNSNSWRVTLRYDGRRMSLDFWTGIGCRGEPDAESVLDCLLSECSALYEDFEEWACNLGFDSDSRKAEKTYKACVKLGNKIKRLLGDDFDAFLESER